MPVISFFYGIIVRMFYFDNQQHHLPHIHVEFAEYKAVLAIETSDVLEGQLPPKKMKLIEAWMEIHREELMADWTLAVTGSEPIKIQPLV
jgi:Domain of unknown function (DUF4160)